jgi:hypothetical protein
MRVNLPHSARQSLRVDTVTTTDDSAVALLRESYGMDRGVSRRDRIVDRDHFGARCLHPGSRNLPSPYPVLRRDWSTIEGSMADAE